MTNEWKDVDHALAYLARADTIPHRTEGEAALIEEQRKAALKRALELILDERGFLFREATQGLQPVSIGRRSIAVTSRR